MASVGASKCCNPSRTCSGEWDPIESDWDDKLVGVIGEFRGDVNFWLTL